MRPHSAEALLQGTTRPRKLSDTRGASDNEREAGFASPMMFFLADEAQVQAATGSNSMCSSATSAAGSSSTTNFGVRSLEASVSDSELRRPSVSGRSSQEQSQQHLHTGLASNTSTSPGTTAASHPDAAKDHVHADNESEIAQEDAILEDDEEEEELDTLSMTSTANQDYVSSRGMSQPMTPLLAPTPDYPGTPRNYNNGRGQEALGVGAPQLIMPEITMPIRRPFTEQGKRIGKLKIMVVGDSGIGKTSLIKSIVQTCEDIVHVDPLSSNVSASGRHSTGSFSGRRSSDSDSTKRITEVYASTRAYPQWWSELDDSKMLRRRSKSSHEEQIIERNLCFVDTPGYGSGTSFLECIEPVVRYVEGQFERTQGLLSNGEGDLMPLIAGDGPAHVDIVFYVVLHRLKPVDIEFIRRLSPYTNVLPVIAKSDTLTPQQVHTLKIAILGELRSAGIRPFTFNLSPSELKRSNSDQSTPMAPFAISSAVAPDTETMDASVLMSPDYVPPLVNTELSHLVSTVFNPDNVSWLKHATAKKFLHWRLNGAPPNSMIQRPLSSGGCQLPPPAFTGSTGLILGTGPESFQLARIADHTQREERLAKVRLSRWATDLQKSLQAERERYERLARGERAIWLTERLSEVVADGQLVPVSQVRKGRSGSSTVSPAMVGPRGVGKGASMSGVDTRDPFGLLRLNEGLVRRVVVLIKVSGMAGFIGLVGVWAYKQWGVTGLEISNLLD